MKAAFTDHDGYIAFVTDPSFYTDHHRLATELASRMGGEETLNEFGWAYPQDADLETVEAAIWRLSVGLGLYLGWCCGAHYKDNQPHISYKQLRPWVIINDVSEQLDILSVRAGISEPHKWHYMNAKMVACAVGRCIGYLIPEELRETVKVDQETVDHWACALGYTFTVGDEEEES
jgi:hypothetical protein